MFPPESQYHSRPEPHTKTNLKTWWHHFNFVQKTKKEALEPYKAHDTADHPVFGKSLKESLRYASVQISTADANGDLYVWGYIPVVVAKCGLYLKENATEVPGTFRVNGSNKRMRDLQAAFETPPRYGKSLDWKQESYTTHDVASVFRRYLTQMPEPVIPHEMYHDFRDALAKKPYNQEEVISTYKALIRRMPRPNQYLLLYVLDLLSVFARKAEKNLMTATNLAVIFRPGIISHPSHEMSPQEHALSQSVLEFLIAHQDWFMLDIIPPMQAGDSYGGDEGYGAGGASGPSHHGGSGGGPRGDYPDRGGGGGGGGHAGGGKWREGTSTPSRQGTKDSAWAGEAGSGSVHRTKTTTRQRVISGAIDVGAWHSYAGASSAPGNRRASMDQRMTGNGSGGWARNERRASAQQYVSSSSVTTSRQATLQAHPYPSQGDKQPERRQTADSYFPVDPEPFASAPAPTTSRKQNPPTPGASNHLATRPSMASQTSSSSTHGHSGAESVFATPMSSLPPSPASSVPGHGYAHGYAQGGQATGAAQNSRSRGGQYQPPSSNPGQMLSFPGSHGHHPHQQHPPPSSYVSPHVRTNSMPTPPTTQTYGHPRNAVAGSSSFGVPPGARSSSPEPMSRHEAPSAKPSPSYTQQQQQQQQQQRQPRLSLGATATPTSSTSTATGAAPRPSAIHMSSSSSKPTPYARERGHTRSASSPSPSPLPSPISDTFSDAVIEETMTVPAVGPREEFSTLGGGGWRLVSPQINGGGYLTLADVAGMGQPGQDGKKKLERTRAKMMRRRTTMDRAELLDDPHAAYENPSNDMTPIAEDGDSGVGGLSRSRTLPMRRKNVHGEDGYPLDPYDNKEYAMKTDEEGNNLGMGANAKAKPEKRVLKKQRRVSAGQKAPAAAAANGM